MIVVAICVAGIAGMIVTSITDHNGAAVTFGLITAVAILCSMVATAVAAGSGGGGRAVAPEDLGASIEARIAAVVEAGADETEVRALVGEAVRFGRSTAAGDRTA